jgi:hypothetical protein
MNSVWVSITASHPHYSQLEFATPVLILQQGARRVPLAGARSFSQEPGPGFVV